MTDVDCVVIGSGFGGSVTAARLAEAGWSVVLLERGRPWPPGSFPRTPRQFGRWGFWDPGDERYGLMDLWSFSGTTSLVSSGLGGGSLIYANVMKRKAAETFDGWPVTREDLEPHYDRVHSVQAPQRYPVEHEPYASTPKTRELRDAAERMGVDAEHPELAVLFAAGDRPPRIGDPIPEDAPNVHDLPRQTCRLVGECDLGCNFGAKNTLDYTYVERALRAGASVWCGCEARVLGRDGGGWTVSYRQHAAVREVTPQRLCDPDPSERRTISAKRVVLAAGTFGTAWLLLSNRASLPGLSPRVGEGFSTNGDLLSFARDCKTPDGGWRWLDMDVGPVITTSVDFGEFSVQDAGVPASVMWAWHSFDLPRNLWEMRKVAARRIWERIKGDVDPNLSAEAARFLGNGRASGAVLGLLSMGLDRPGGRFRLDGDDLELSWSESDSAEYFARMRAGTRRVAEELGGEFFEAPFAKIWTNHPLGGAAMGASATEGVVDVRNGEVFGQPGLHVADGAVLPGPVGPNPSWTIAAVADRFCDAMIDAGP